MSNVQATYTTQSVSSIQCMHTTQSMSTIQAMYAPQPKSTTKSKNYIIITGLGRRCVTLKSQVSTYQVLINYIHAFFPGTYQRLHRNNIPLPIVIQTCDLPAYKGYIVDIQPNVWATIIADIDNI
ncbi:hypothetical protein EV421DRAFT_1914339 [Armillaria borealis]|uniref:Uncharacterized protein n=1 Tax=Armillaria borealis TaxID=47425 RepID=A0AA39IUW3_9AGAR|nr:hypothetical protein EV421DRAFT_1914339 [Armillaria borealis]